MKTIRVRGRGGAEWDLDLTPRAQKLIDRGWVTPVKASKATKATESEQVPDEADGPAVDPDS